LLLRHAPLRRHTAVVRWHYARLDYGPDEHRLMKRCQVMATKIFDPDFLGESLMTARAA
jgi:hypothetical protein